VLDEFGAYPAAIANELQRYLPFLATTKVLMAAVKAGVGREVAHAAIKEHAVAAALAMRDQGGAGGAALLDRLAQDPRLKLSRGQIDAVLAEPLTFTGASAQQVAAVVKRIHEVTRQYPRAGTYSPEPIL